MQSPPVGLHVFPPTKQEASAGCSPPCWVTRILSHSTGTERRVRHARVQKRAAQMVADEPCRAPAFRPRTVVFSIPSPPHCNAAAPAGSFLCSFSFCERKRTKKKAQEPAWVGPLRASVSGTYLPRKKYFAGLFFEKPRREKWVTDEGGGLPNRRETDDRRGLPAGLRASPSPLRFLFFGSFFSFLERKERTEKIKGKKESTLRQPRRMRGRFQR